MNVLLAKLVVLLTALAAATHAAPHAFTGTGGKVVWTYTKGKELYDTPSGNLDAGFYVVNSDSSNLAHLASSLTATTTQPDGFYPVKDVTGLNQAHIIGTRYTDYFSDGNAYIGDQALDANISKSNAIIPSITNDQVVGTQMISL